MHVMTTLEIVLSAGQFSYANSEVRDVCVCVCVLFPTHGAHMAWSKLSICRHNITWVGKMYNITRNVI